jgi:streptogramin lyase
MIARISSGLVLVMLCISVGAGAGAASPRASQAAATVPHVGSANADSMRSVKFFATPTAFSWPYYIVAGPQGALWFTEFFANNIGRITTSGQVTEFPLALQDGGPQGIAAGADGNIWFTDPGANLIGRMTPSGAVTNFPIAAPNPDPRGITAGPDGNLWYVEFNDGYIGRVTPAGAITRFAIGNANSAPWDITTGPDGDLWFTESANGVIGRFNPQTLTFDQPLTVPTGGATPWGILLAPSGTVWVSERNGNKLASVQSGNITQFSIPQKTSYPDRIVASSDGGLWFTEQLAGDIGRFDPSTGKFERSVVLPSGSIPLGIAVGPDKNLWFTVASYHNAGTIGEIVLH